MRIDNVHWSSINFHPQGKICVIKAVAFDENLQASPFSIKMSILLEVSFTLKIQVSNPLVSADPGCSLFHAFDYKLYLFMHLFIIYLILLP